MAGTKSRSTWPAGTSTRNRAAVSATRPAPARCAISVSERANPLAPESDEPHDEPLPGPPAAHETRRPSPLARSWYGSSALAAPSGPVGSTAAPSKLVTDPRLSHVSHPAVSLTPRVRPHLGCGGAVAVLGRCLHAAAIRAATPTVGLGPALKLTFGDAAGGALTARDSPLHPQLNHGRDSGEWTSRSDQSMACTSDQSVECKVQCVEECLLVRRLHKGACWNVGVLVQG